MNDKLLLQDLVVLLAKKSGITQKDADKFFRELFQLILERIYENDIVKIKDLGTFKLVEISSRESVDVNTGEKIEIPAHYKMAFTPDRSLRELVNEPFAHFESVVLDDNNEGSEEQEYSINDFAATIADNFKPVVNSFPDIDDELLLDDDDDDDLLETDLDDLDDESNDFFQEQLFVSESSANQNKPNIATKPEPHTVEEEKDPDTIDKSVTPTEEKKVERKAPPLLDLIDIRRDRPKTTQIVREKEEAHDEILLSDTDIDIDINDTPPHTEDIVKQEDKKQKPVHTTRQDDEDTQDEIEYTYIDYDKIEKASSKRRRIPLIIAIIIILAFAAYQFAKLFDITHDYEYYINHVPPLTLSDSIRIVDEVAEPNPLYNTRVADSTSNTANRRTNRSAQAINPLTEERMESNLDELDRQLHTQHRIERKGIHISERLQIRITNKAQIYLSEK